MPTPDCDCVTKPPSYPTYRENPHLPDCVWWYVNRLEVALDAHRQAADARDSRLIRRVTDLEERLNTPPPVRQGGWVPGTCPGCTKCDPENYPAPDTHSGLDALWQAVIDAEDGTHEERRQWGRIIDSDYEAFETAKANLIAAVRAESAAALREATAEVERLRAWVRYSGNHVQSCPKRMDQTVDCECGWWAIVQEDLAVQAAASRPVPAPSAGNEPDGSAYVGESGRLTSPATCQARIAMNTENGPSSYLCGRPTPCSWHYTATQCCTDPRLFDTDNGKRQCATCGQAITRPVLPDEDAAEWEAQRDLQQKFQPEPTPEPHTNEEVPDVR